jgi:WD40 repeat protein
MVLLRAYSHHIVSMCFSPDDKRLATAGGEVEDSAKGGGLKLWDVVSGQEVLSLGGPTDIIHHVLFSPDGRRLYSSRMLGLDLGMAFRPPSELFIWPADTADRSQAR